MYAWPGRMSKLSVSSARRYLARTFVARSASSISMPLPKAGFAKGGSYLEHSSGILRKSSVGEKCQESIEGQGQSSGGCHPERDDAEPPAHARSALSPAPAERPLRRLATTAGEYDREDAEQRRERGRGAGLDERSARRSTVRRRARAARSRLRPRRRRATRRRAGSARAAAPSRSLLDVGPADGGGRDRAADDAGHDDERHDVGQRAEERRPGGVGSVRAGQAQGKRLREPEEETGDECAARPPVVRK